MIVWFFLVTTLLTSMYTYESVRDPYCDPYKSVIDPYESVSDPYKSVSDPYESVCDPYKSVIHPY